MRIARRVASVAVLILVSDLAFAAGRQTAVASPPTLTRADMEAFMLRARIVKRKGVSKGITGTMRATLSDDTLTHDVSIQKIDESKREFTTAQGKELNFRDSWLFNLAAYELDKMLDLQMIPATVARRVDGNESSVTWWVDDVLMDEGERIKKKVSPPGPRDWNDQMMVVRVFDQLIFNTDRNLGNLLIDKQWRIWMIDHTRAFRWTKELRSPENLQRCDRSLLAKLKALTKENLEAALDDYLGENEIKGVLARRDLIVAHFEQMGEKALYDAPRRSR